MNKTILVGDVGSTKSTWRYNADTIHEVQLPGFNPLVHSAETGEYVFNFLSNSLGEMNPEEIWYYGTGIIDSHVAGDVHARIKKIFPKTTIHVSSDLEGAAIAACGRDAGTVAILGTGSHAAVFDGHKIIRQATSLGYILGDEGGGCDLGKALLQAYFYNEMPDAIRRELSPMIPDGRAGILNNLKLSPVPNQYLAEFAKVAVVFQENSWIQDLVSSRFRLFVKRHVVPLSPIGPVHIVGSIGCIFAGLISQELKNSQFETGTFIKEPVTRLFEIHTAYGRTEK